MDPLFEFRQFFSRDLDEIASRFRNISIEEYLSGIGYDPDLDCRWKATPAPESSDVYSDTYLDSILTLRFKSIRESVAKNLDDLMAVARQDATMMKSMESYLKMDFNSIRENVRQREDLTRYQNQILEFIVDIQAKVAIAIRNLDKPRKVVKEPSLVYSFGFLKERYSEKLLDDLHEFHFLNTDFVDSRYTSKDDFSNLLTSKDFRQCHATIRFSCETKQVIKVLDEITVFFDNLTPTIIENSNLFLTADGVPLTAENIYSSRLSGKKLPVKGEREIITFINRLRTTYLKK